MPGGILTTHVGSLPRPAALLDLLVEKKQKGSVDEAKLAATARAAVADCVKKQLGAGLDVVSDGEMAKPSYVSYIAQRYDGFGVVEGRRPQPTADLAAFPQFARQQVEMQRIGNKVRNTASTGSFKKATSQCCVGDLRPRDTALLDADLDNFAAALRPAPPAASFMTAASPGVISLFCDNQHYPSHRSYIEALAGVMQQEYEAIHRAGHIVQIDCPDLAMGHNMKWQHMPMPEFREQCALHIEALNHATRNIPEDRLRLHVCWGNWEGPHHHDIAFGEIASQVFAARPKYLLIETANPRHSHEVDDFRQVYRLPENKVLVPGVVDVKTNYIEHPRLIAKRIREWVGVIGAPERVMAAPDCGFGTFDEVATVYPDIAWAKMRSLADGARLAGRELGLSDESKM